MRQSLEGEIIDKTIEKNTRKPDQKHLWCLAYKREVQEYQKLTEKESIMLPYYNDTIQ
jgi:hypothetical protein